jgi:hypothetical protein
MRLSEIQMVCPSLRQVNDLLFSNLTRNSAVHVRKLFEIFTVPEAPSLMEEDPRS